MLCRNTTLLLFKVGVFVWGILVESSLTMALDGANALQLSTLNGWKSFELITQGDNISSLSDPNYGGTASRGSYDGLGAYLAGETLSIHVNHELDNDAATSRVDLNLSDFRQAIASTIDNNAATFPASIVTGMGFSYDTVFDGTYHAVSNPSPAASGTTAVAAYGALNFSRFCSGTSYQPNAFGANRGVVDPIYLTGEETFDEQGEFYALDQATRTLWEVPDLGTSSWENAAQVDSGTTTHTAFLLSDDGGDRHLHLYIGEKDIDANGDGVVDFLERNGLRGGTVYFFHPDPPASTTDLPNGQVTGTWSTSTVGALTEDKLEDIHTNPLDGTQVMLSDQTDGVYSIELNLQFSGGSFNANTSTTTIDQIDADLGSEPSGIGSPDNLVWSKDGSIYVQEDGDGNDMWRMNSDGTALSQIAHAFSEPSGIFDVSETVGYQPGSVLLTSVQGTGSAEAQLSVLISPTAAPLSQSADFDGDGDVDGTDFLSWQRGSGKSGGPGHAAGDANYDGVINAYDLALWEAQYGSGSLMTNVANVPEPATYLLLVLASFGWLWRYL